HEQLVHQLNHEQQTHLVSKERIKQVGHEAQDLAHTVEEQWFKIAQLEKAMSEIAFLADVPAFPFLHIAGEAQSCNVEQLQRDDDAQETNALLLSTAGDQGRQLRAAEAKKSILDGQVSSTDESTQGALGNPWSIDLCEDTTLAVVDVEEHHGKPAGHAAAALEGEDVDGDVLILKASQSLKDDEVEDPHDERRRSGGPRRPLILQRHFFQTACLDEMAVDLEELQRMLSSSRSSARPS
ncbi:unnamed protein product, partial [Prorocentrum cordatum]